MIRKRRLIPGELQPIIQRLCGKKIISVIHPSGSILMMQLGESVFNEDGKKQGKYQLGLWGRWEYLEVNGKKTTSWRLPEDTHTDFFMRMEDFAEQFPAKEISNITVADSDRQVVFRLDTGATLTVWPQSSGFINFSEFLTDQSGKITGAQHVRPDEKKRRELEYLEYVASE